MKGLVVVWLKSGAEMSKKVMSKRSLVCESAPHQREKKSLKKVPKKFLFPNRIDYFYIIK